MSFSLEKRCYGVNYKKKQLISIKINNEFQLFRIHTKGDKSIWFLLKKYINNLKVNEEFTRTDLLSCVYIDEIISGMKACQTTVDQYRRYITINGFLSHIGYAKYKKLKNIPENVSIYKLKIHVYDKSWKSWYIKPEDL